MGWDGLGRRQIPGFSRRNEEAGERLGAELFSKRWRLWAESRLRGGK